MSDLSTDVRACIDTRVALIRYLETNGADGSDELRELRAREDSAFTALDGIVALKE